MTYTPTFKSFTSSDEVVLSANNFTITLTKGTNNAPAFASEQARIYPGGTLIISSTNNITKIEYNYTINANKKDKVPTVDGAEGSKAAGTWNEATMTWTGSDTEVIFSISGEAGNVGFTSVTVTTNGEGSEGEGGEGEGGEGEGEGGEIVVTNLNYVDAIFYEDETYGDYWEFDFYKDLDEEGYILSPYVYFVCEESTTSSTKIAGTWSAYDAGYFETDEEESGVYTDEEDPVGSLTVTCVGEGLYNFAGSFVGDDGKTYKWNLNNMDVYAYNGDTYEDISLDDDQPTSVENTEANVQSAIKTLRNGQVLIRKNNKVYTVLGQEVK